MIVRCEKWLRQSCLGGHPSPLALVIGAADAGNPLNGPARRIGHAACRPPSPRLRRDATPPCTLAHPIRRHYRKRALVDGVPLCGA
jgi:hypothetical protein